MIINHISNIHKYLSIYPHLSEAADYIQNADFSTLKEGTNEVSDNFHIVKIVAEKKADFEGVLEVHRKWIDVHIPFNTHDLLAYKALSLCQNIEKEYDPEKDYMLYREADSALAVLPKGYFAIIDETVCHMAMLGEGRIEKLVFKIKI